MKQEEFPEKIQLSPHCMDIDAGLPTAFFGESEDGINYVREDKTLTRKELCLISRIVSHYQNEIGMLGRILFGADEFDHPSLLNGELGNQYELLEDLHYKIWGIVERMQKED